MAALILGNIGNPMAVEPLEHALVYANAVGSFFRQSVEEALERLTKLAKGEKPEKLRIGQRHSEFHGIVLCKNGHPNNPTSKVCWKCGSPTAKVC